MLFALAFRPARVWRRCIKLVPAVVILAILMISRACLAQATSSGEDFEEGARALAATYVENRDSFQHVECTYELRQFRHEDEESVFRDVAVVEGQAKGLLVRDGSKIRRQIIVSDADLDKAMQMERIVFDPRQLLLDGERGVTYSRDIKGGVLYSSAYPPEKLIITPFDYGRFTGSRGFFHPGLILNCSEIHPVDEGVPEEPHAAVDSIEMVGIECRLKAGSGSLRFQFFLAPAHGCLPIVCRSYLNDRPLQKSVITDIRDVGKGRFYPMRSLNLQYTEGEPPINWAVETRVTSLTVDQPVAPSLFQIKIEKGGVLRDAADDNSQFRILEDQVVGLDGLDDLFQRAAAQSKQEALWARARSEAAEAVEVAEVAETGMAMPTWIILPLVCVVGLALLILLIRLRTR